VQPTLRALWAITDRQQVWGAVSRALRAPARADQGLRVNLTSFPGQGGLPVVVVLMGHPEYESVTAAVGREP
jgi:ribosomal protein S12 methylthiotransferase accessory factor YcaO